MNRGLLFNFEHLWGATNQDMLLIERCSCLRLYGNLPGIILDAVVDSAEPPPPTTKDDPTENIF